MFLKVLSTHSDPKPNSSVLGNQETQHRELTWNPIWKDPATPGSSLSCLPSGQRPAGRRLQRQRRDRPPKAHWPSDDSWLRPGFSPVPRQVSRSPLAMLKAAGTSERLPALGFLCKDSECRVTIETRQARKLWETTSFTALRKIYLGHVPDRIYYNRRQCYLRTGGAQWL